MIGDIISYGLFLLVGFGALYYMYKHLKKKMIAHGCDSCDSSCKGCDESTEKENGVPVTQGLTKKRK